MRVTFGWVASASAIVAAVAVWRSTRTLSVSSPFSNTQALNGEIDGPVWRIRTCTWSRMNFSDASTTPPRQRPWPSMCLVAE